MKRLMLVLRQCAARKKLKNDFSLETKKELIALFLFHPTLRSIYPLPIKIQNIDPL